MVGKVLVIGAGGYIGDGVARAFRRHGYVVYGVVRKEEQKRHLLVHEIIPIVGDLDHPEAYESIIKECTIIIDAAGIVGGSSQHLFAHIKKVKANPIHNYKTLYMFTSGIMIYYPGHYEASLIPKTEAQEVNPTDKIEMIPKKHLENDILQTTEVRTVVLRPGFVYGGHGGVILPMFFGVDPNEKQLVLTGRPDKRWSWVHVDDLGEAYVKVAQAGSVVDRQVFNLSAQDNPTYEELKLACARAAGWKGTKDDIKVVPVPESQPRLHNWETNVIINPQKAFDVLGWKPSHVGVLNEAELYYQSWKASQGK